MVDGKPHVAAEDPCGDAHPATNAASASNDNGVDACDQNDNAADGAQKDDHGENDDETDNDDNDEDNAEDATLQAAECMVTSTRHDDWLHRGPFLADLPWQAYMMRVQRIRKPTVANADHAQLFFFDKHYTLSTLYCQEIQYSGRVAIPRVVGSVCPPQEEDGGEPHAAYKLMLFSRTLCPGPGACADPLMHRQLLIPSDKPNDPQLALAKPRFAPCWKACKCELEVKAKIAKEKEKRAQKML